VSGLSQKLPRIIACALAGAMLPFGALAAEPPEIVVVASKRPEPFDAVPAAVTVVSGNELRARHATDLRGALALAAGVDVAPGSDAGPGGSAPALWGLRELDAFLLVVDGVPWGGAFNPALTSLDLNNIDRIEILRGAAPVNFGATSFIGVIEAIHKQAGEAPNRVSLTLGTRQTVKGAVSFSLPELGALKQSIQIDGESRAFSQDRADLKRFHGLYRGRAETAIGSLHFDLDGTVLRQVPYSPHPREGTSLTSRFPLDANVNPADARADESRVQFNIGLDRTLGPFDWITLVSVAHTTNRNTRGFLRDGFSDDGVTPNADGFRQRIRRTDVYVDSSFSAHPLKTMTWIFGVDWLFGDGRQESDNFEYAVFPNGSNAPVSTSLHTDEHTVLSDKRSFGGLYTEIEWQPLEPLHISAGLRLNRTEEKRSGSVTDFTTPGFPVDASADERTKTRLSYAVGASYALWKKAEDNVTVFADYRDAYKPAAVDFGPEAEGAILRPETADSFEAGLKSRLAQGRFEWEASYFNMSFANLVIAENVSGLPALANAGKERFTGAEFEARAHLLEDLTLAASYAYHDAHFTDYLRLDGASLQQLAGNKLELSPQHLASLGAFYAPKQGFQASVTWNYVGSRFLNKTNTALAGSYSTLDAGLGYKIGGATFRVDGVNLTDRRDPVAESELGDAQFYRLPGTVVLFTVELDL
jgi:iron complex outermembrane recepter protein